MLSSQRWGVIENPLVYLDVYIPIVGMYCVGIVATVGSTK